MKIIKIVILGAAGGVGSESGREIYNLLLNNKERIPHDSEVEIILIDRNYLKAQVKSNDILSAIHAEECPQVRYFVTQDMTKLDNAHLIVFCMGKSAGREATSREARLDYNLDIVDDYAHLIKRQASYALILVITNPVELITLRFKTITEFPYDKVVGLGLAVDQRRFAQKLARQLRSIYQHDAITAANIDTMIVGEHSETGMIFLDDHIFVGKKNLKDFVKEKGLDMRVINQILMTCQQETREEGFNHVRNSDGQSARCTPAAVVRDFTKAYLFEGNLNTVFSICFSITGVGITCVGLPVKVSKGLIQINHFPLNGSEIKKIMALSLEIAKKGKLAFEEHDIKIRVKNNMNKKLRFFSSEDDTIFFHEARCHFMKGDYLNAISILKKIEIISLTQENKLRFYLDLGVSYNLIGNSNDAFECYEKASLYWNNLYGKNHLKQSDFLKKTFSRVSKFSENKFFYNRPLKIEKKISKSFSLNFARIFNNLGNLFHDQEIYQEALKLYKITCNLCLENPEKGGFLYYAIALGNIANVQSQLGQFEKSAKYHDKSISEIKLYKGWESMHYASAINNKANLYYHQGKYQDALALHHNALFIIQKNLEQDYNESHEYNHLDYAIACFNIGMDQEMLTEWEEAEKYYKRARKIFQNFKLDHYIKIAENKISVKKEPLIEVKDLEAILPSSKL